MARQDGVWVEYKAETQPVIVRTFGSEIASARSALRNGNRITRIHFGETIAEAIERERNEAKAPASGKAATPRQTPGVTSE